MKIKVLGTRGKIEPSAENYKNHTAFLIDNKILVDVGEAHYMEHNPEAVVFTHFHPDHAYFVETKEKFAPKIPLFGPEEQDFAPGLQVVDGEFNIGEYSFRPVPVLHALRLKSLGYIIEKGGKKIFITGDVAWIEKADLEHVGSLDAVFTEATFLRKGGRIHKKKDRIFGHTGVPDLVRILGPLTDKIIFSHYGNWFFEDPEKSVQQLKAQADDPVIIPAHDGMEIEI